jgi:hypothetical protein
MRFPSITLASPIPPQFMPMAEPGFDGAFAAEVLTLQQEKGATEAAGVPGLPSLAPPPYPEVPPSPLLLHHTGTVADAVADAALPSKEATTENVTNAPEISVFARADNPLDEIVPPTPMPDSRSDSGLTAPFAALAIPFVAKAPLAPDAPTTTAYVPGPATKTLPTPALGQMPALSGTIPAGLPTPVLSVPDRTEPSVLSAPVSAAKAAPDPSFPVQIAPSQLAPNQPIPNELPPSPMAPSPMAPSPMASNPLAPSQLATNPLAPSPIAPSPIARSPSAPGDLAASPLAASPSAANQMSPSPAAPSPVALGSLAPSPMFPGNLATVQPTPVQPPPAQQTPAQPPEVQTAPVQAGSTIPVRAFATTPGDTLPPPDMTLPARESGSVPPKTALAAVAAATSPVPQTPPSPTAPPQASPAPAASAQTTALPVPAARIIATAYVPPLGAAAFVELPISVATQTPPSTPTPLADAFLAPVFTPPVFSPPVFPPPAQGITTPASPPATGPVADGPPPISQAVSPDLTTPILPGPGSAGPNPIGPGAAIAAPTSQIPTAMVAPQPDPAGAISNGKVRMDRADVIKAPPKLPSPILSAASAGPAPSTPPWPATRRSVMAESQLPSPTQMPTVAMPDPGPPSQAADPRLQRANSQMVAPDPTTPSLPVVIMDGSSVPPLPTPDPATATANPESKPDHSPHLMTGVSATDASLPKNVSNMAQMVETITNPLPTSSQETIPQQSPAPAAAPPADLPEVVLPSASPTPQRAALADQLILLVQAPPQGSVTLTLAPEDLGTLRFDVQHVADSISVHLTVERPETLDLLRRHADHLAEAFRQAGFSGASFTFGGGDGGQRDRPPTPSTAQWAETTPPTAERHVAGLLDLRL